MSKELNHTCVVEVVYRNDKGYYNIKDTEDNWFGFGKAKPHFEKGNEISFEYTKNGKFANADPKSVEVISEEAPGNSTAQAATKTKAVNKTQDEIRYQASRNAAIALVGPALEAGLIDLGKSTKKGAQLENLVAYVNELAADFNEDTLNFVYGPQEVDEDKAVNSEEDDDD